MATTKKKSPTVSANPVVFAKRRILKMKRYAKRRDLLSVLLDDEKMYTLDQVDGLIDDFMKG